MSASGFPEQCGFSFCSCRDPGFKHISVIVHDIFARFAFSVSATQINVVKEWCWLAQTDFFHKYFQHWVDVLFLSSQFFVVHMHRQEHSQNLELLPNRVPTELSRTAFPIMGLPEDDRADFAQEDRLGLPSWTLISAICDWLDVSKNLDIPTGIFNNDGSFSILTWV